MVKNRRNILGRFIHSQWIITLTSTMIGVLLGLYLNDAYQRNLLIDGKKNALAQVSEEISQNEESLKVYSSDIETKYQELTYLFGQFNEKMKIIIPSDSLDAFKKNTAGVVNITGTKALSDTTIQVNGGLDLQLDSPLLIRNLSDITWESFKQTDYLSITKFRCLVDVESVYELQDEINKINYSWRDDFIHGKFMSSSPERNEFMATMRNLIEKQKLLLFFYSKKEEMLTNCE